jgi:hypothetical protein
MFQYHQNNPTNATTTISDTIIMTVAAFDCLATMCRQDESTALHVAISPIHDVIITALHFLRKM